MADDVCRNYVGIDPNRPPNQEFTPEYLRSAITAASDYFDTAETGLVIIDSLRAALLGKALSGDENDNVAMSKLLKPYRLLARETKWSVMIAHHDNRSGEALAGAGAIRGHLDGLWHLTRNQSKRKLKIWTRRGEFPPWEIRQTDQGLVKVCEVEDESEEDDVAKFVASFPAKSAAITKDEAVSKQLATSPSDFDRKFKAAQGGVSRFCEAKKPSAAHPYKYYRTAV